MKSLYIKEITAFFSSMMGYLIIIVFLTVNGLFLWIFPGEMNILDAGYASLGTLFTIAPWVFLFLIPAITMRSFAEEKKSGTIELLLTRPLSEMQIVLAKYLANVTLAILSILPTLFFYVSVRQLSPGASTIDTGATWGSYLGLVFLAAVYISIGLFVSSLTENTLVSFILAVLLCFILYTGFNSIAYLSEGGKMGTILLNFGIDAHYQSIGRGVVDSRDLLYFISVIILFLLLTRTKLSSRKWIG
jgi:ABC-2 type transport system permease protein